MVLSPGYLAEQSKLVCPSGDSSTEWRNWNGAWLYTQKAYEFGARSQPMHYLIKDWNWVGGEIYATKTLDGSYTDSASGSASGVTYTLHMQFTFRHAPLK